MSSLSSLSSVSSLSSLSSLFMSMSSLSSAVILSRSERGKRILHWAGYWPYKDLGILHVISVYD